MGAVGRELSQETPGNQGASQTGAAKSAALPSDSMFSEAVQSIMALPLSDAEKAEAVRRLLAGRVER